MPNTKRTTVIVRDAVKQKTRNEWVIAIVLRLVFPPILVWDFLKWLVTALLGRAFGKIFLPSQLIEPDVKTRNRRYLKELVRTEANKDLFNRVKIQSDEADVEHGEIDALEISPIGEPNKNKNPLEIDYILNVVGQNRSYAETDILTEMRDDADQIKAQVIGFDYQGVGRSKTVGSNANETRDKIQSIEEPFIDVMRMVRYLIEHKGADPRRITLKGTGMGAVFAIQAAQALHQQNECVKVFAHNAPSNLTDLIICKIAVLGSRDNKPTILGTIASYFAWPFVKLALVLSGWEFEVAKAYDEIPLNVKGYSLIRPKHEDTNDQSTIINDEQPLPPGASLHDASPIESERKREKSFYQSQIRAAHEDVQTSSNFQTVPFVASARNSYELALKSLSSCKMTVPRVAAEATEHEVERRGLLSQMQCRKFLATGNDFFHIFCDPKRKNLSHFPLDPEESILMRSELPSVTFS